MTPAFIEPQIFTVVGIIAIVLVAGTITLVRYKRKPKKFSRGVEMALGLLVLVVGALASNLTFNIQTGIMNSERLNSIEENYGISLSSSELAELHAPRDAPPAPDEGEYTSFGVTQTVHEGKVLTMFLTWDGETFTLRDTDGEPLATTAN